MSEKMYRETTTPMIEKAPAEKRMQIAAVTSVSIGTFCAGTVLCWTSPALSHIETPTAINSTTPGFTVTPSEGALIASTLTLGALLSAIPAGYFADKFGRKPVILSLAAMFLLNWIMITFARSLTVVLIARLFAGIGLGGICVVAPIYIGEISEASHRGFFGSFLQLGLAGGVFYTCLAGNFAGWTGLGAALAATPLLLGATFAFMPESPVYLIGKGRRKRAERNLRALRGPLYDIDEEVRAAEENAAAAAAKERVGVAALVASKANARALASAVGVLVCQQFSGINVIVFYTVAIFQAAETDLSPFVSALIVNAVQWASSLIPMVTIERANRKVFLMASSLGMMACLVGLGVFFHLKLIVIDAASRFGYLPLTSTVLFMVFFCIGYGPIPWMLLGELFSPEIKGFAGGISILVNWTSAFVVTFAFPLIKEAYGMHVAFYILGGIMGAATLFVCFVVPETRGKTLNQIQEELNR